MAGKPQPKGDPAALRAHLFAWKEGAGYESWSDLARAIGESRQAICVSLERGRFSRRVAAKLLRLSKDALDVSILLGMRS